MKCGAHALVIGLPLSAGAVFVQPVCSSQEPTRPPPRSPNLTNAAAAEEIGIVYEDRFGAVKDDEAARRRLQEEKSEDLAAQFRRKLDRVLTTGQKEVMARAAEEENRRLAETAAFKKPAK